ncbi:MAG: hypothetical protein AAF732_20095, partial [Pseudomonadota bacterium]
QAGTAREREALIALFARGSVFALPLATIARYLSACELALFARLQARGSSAGYPASPVPGRDRGPARCAAPAEGPSKARNSP